MERIGGDKGFDGVRAGLEDFRGEFSPVLLVVVPVPLGGVLNRFGVTHRIEQACS